MSIETEEINKLPIFRSDRNAQEIIAYDTHTNQRLPDDEIDLRSLWKTVIKYRWTIASISFLFLVTTVIATLLMRPVYRAEVLLEIKTPSGSVVKFQNLEQTDYQPLEYKNTQQNILQSSSVAETVISQFSLAENPEFSGQITQRGFVNGLKQLIKPMKVMVEEYIDLDVSTDSQNSDSETDKELFEILKRFDNRLTVSPIKRSDLFLVNFDSFSPELAAGIANSVVDNYITLNENRRFGSTSGAKHFLELEIQKVQARLETSERDLTEYAREHEIIDVEDKDDIITTQLNDISAQLTVATGQRIAAEALYIQSRSADGFSVLPQVLKSDLIQKLKSQYAVLQGEYFKLSNIYKSAYPRLVQLNEEMNRIKLSLDTEVAQIANSLQSDYEQSLKKEKLLEEKVEEHKVELLSLKDRSIQYNILKREWETNKELYTGLLERMKEVGVAAGMEIDNITIIDRARIPVVQFKPNLIQNATLATSLGLFVGIGIAFLLSFLDNTVRTPEELENLVGMVSLGVIPKFQGGNLSTSSETPKMRRSRLGLISHFERDQEMSEAFRSIRTSLMFSTPSGMPKVLQVTSTIPGEGKTTVASNIAAVMADNGVSVALVDADLRKPALNKVFGVPSMPGLSESLTKQLEKIPVYKTKIDGLSLVPAGTLPPNPAELLGSPAFDQFLVTLGKHYDHVVIDSAPLLGLADSVIISTKVDGLVYTVHAGEISRDGLREGIKRLRRVNAPILGAILSQADLSSGEYGAYADSSFYKYGSPYSQSQIKHRTQ